ncbi:unannotated protein [freshwater metagenome]|uniref:Unannotated protein n=1 Tax=freshwater metagenome TaxID=449393 RepID=A0A6J7UKG0_9ZZZZ
MISTRIRGHSHSETRVAIECGSSSRVTASSCSRTSSATLNGSGASVTSPSGYHRGPSGRRDTRYSTSSSTPSPVLAEIGKYSANSKDAALESCDIMRSAVAASVLLSTRTEFFGIRSAIYRSPGPIAAVASMSKQATSIPSSEDVAVSFSRSPINVRGRWIPGVSTNTICDSGRLSTPRIWCRVVCGLSETIEIF